MTDMQDMASVTLTFGEWGWLMADVDNSILLHGKTPLGDSLKSLSEKIKTQIAGQMGLTSDIVSIVDAMNDNSA